MEVADPCIRTYVLTGLMSLDPQGIDALEMNAGGGITEKRVAGMETCRWTV